MFVMAQLWGINPFLAVVLCLVAPGDRRGTDLCSPAPPRWPLFRHRHLGRGRGVPAGHLGLPLCEFRCRHEPARDDRLFGRTSGPSAFRCSARFCCSSPSAAATGFCARATVLPDRDARQSGRRGEPGRQRRPPALPHLDRCRRRHRIRRRRSISWRSLRITPPSAYDPNWANIAIFIVMVGRVGVPRRGADRRAASTSSPTAGSANTARPTSSCWAC